MLRRPTFRVNWKIDPLLGHQCKPVPPETTESVRLFENKGLISITQFLKGGFSRFVAGIKMSSILGGKYCED